MSLARPNEVTSVKVARLTPVEYDKIEARARNLAMGYRGTDAGALGVQVGIELTLRALREGAVHVE